MTKKPERITDFEQLLAEENTRTFGKPSPQPLTGREHAQRRQQKLKNRQLQSKLTETPSKNPTAAPQSTKKRAAQVIVQNIAKKKQRNDESKERFSELRDLAKELDNKDAELTTMENRYLEIVMQEERTFEMNVLMTPACTEFDTPLRGTTTSVNNSPAIANATVTSRRKLLFKEQIPSIDEGRVMEEATPTMRPLEVDRNMTISLATVDDGKWIFLGTISHSGTVEDYTQVEDSMLLLQDGVIKQVGYVTNKAPGVLSKITTMGYAKSTKELVTGIHCLEGVHEDDWITQIESHGSFLVGKGAPKVGDTVNMYLWKYIAGTGKFEGPQHFSIPAWSFGVTASAIVAFDGWELFGPEASRLRSVEIGVDESGGPMIGTAGEDDTITCKIHERKIIHKNRKKVKIACGGESIWLFAEAKKGNRWMGKIYYPLEDGLKQCGKFNEGMAVDIAANSTHGFVCTMGGDIHFALASTPNKWNQPKGQTRKVAFIEAMDRYCLGAVSSGSKVVVIDPVSSKSTVLDLEPALALAPTAGESIEKVAYMAGAGPFVSFLSFMQEPAAINGDESGQEEDDSKPAAVAN